eukprot:6466781-Amphidinium_carterae.1
MFGSPRFTAQVLLSLEISTLFSKRDIFFAFGLILKSDTFHFGRPCESLAGGSLRSCLGPRCQCSGKVVKQSEQEEMRMHGTSVKSDTDVASEQVARCKGRLDSSGARSAATRVLC